MYLFHHIHINNFCKYIYEICKLGFKLRTNINLCHCHKRSLFSSISRVNLYQFEKLMIILLFSNSLYFRYNIENEFTNFSQIIDL